MASKTTAVRKKSVSNSRKSAAVKKEPGSRKKTPANKEQFAEFVQKRAYYIWQESGRPQGKDWDIWLAAEQDIRSQVDPQ